MGLAQTWVIPTNSKFQWPAWKPLLAVSVLWWLCDVLSQNSPAAKETAITYKIVNTAIDELVNEQLAGEHKDPHHYFNLLLTKIEDIVEIVFGRSKVSGVQVSTNIMVLEGTNNDQLRICVWGTRFGNRDYISLKVEPKNTLPGAPTAAVTKKLTYVSNTMAREVKEYFDEDKDYRSIVSIPLMLADKTVCAVINIDCNEANFFRSEKFLQEHLERKIQPLMSLILLEKANLPKAKVV